LAPGTPRPQPTADPTSADWIVERIHPFGTDVGSVIPEGFEAYARLFHRAWRVLGGDPVPVKWSEVAAATERVAHPRMQWERVSGVPPHQPSPRPDVWDHEPDEGHLPRSYVERLVDLLGGYTATPDRVWFAVWEGWGGLWPTTTGVMRLGYRPLYRRVFRRLRGRAAGLAGRFRRPPKAPPPTFRLPARGFYLFHGSLQAALHSYSVSLYPFWTPANLWWPDDRAWCVATEIDFAWTYVGASAPCIQAVLADPGIEALPVDIDDPIGFDSDDVNPAP
jgi:hypothetical protein